MKFKFLALAICLATCNLLHLQAAGQKDTPYKKQSMQKGMSKGKSAPNFFGASSSTTIPLDGTMNPVFVPLSFEVHEHSHGKSIKAEDSSHFKLEKGKYLVLFSGTFVAVQSLFSPFQQVEEVDYATIEVALQLGSNVIFINTDTHDTFDDTTGVSAITKVVEVNEPTTLSVVAKAPGIGNFVNASFRSITILKLT